MDPVRLARHCSIVERQLHRLEIDEARARFLSDPGLVISALQDSTPQQWDLPYAAYVHAALVANSPSDYFVGILNNLREHGLEQLEVLVLDTEHDRPTIDAGSEGSEVDQPVRPEWITYVYSRVAAAILVADHDPQHAIRLNEPVSESLKALDQIRTWQRTFPFSLSMLRERLPILYERVGRFEDALNSSLPVTSRFSDTSEQYEIAVRRFNGWAVRLADTCAVPEVKRSLDLMYGVMQRVSEVDRLEREQLGDCPPDTRQFWAWLYGYSIGQILVNQPWLREALIAELNAGDWPDGWACAGALFDLPSQSWTEYRQTALRLYHAADIEYGPNNSTSTTMPGIPFGERQPPHLSAQSDLYWAIRVGFADAHLLNGEDKPPSLRIIAESLDRVETIVSSSGQRILRIENEMDPHWEAIERGLPPTDNYWIEKLRESLADVWVALPEATQADLIDAMAKGHANDADGWRLATSKAVEAVISEHVVAKVKGLQDAADLIISVPSRVLKNGAG